MGLYFKDIEITNIDNLVPQIGLDITDIWFGSTNIYTVWKTYEGPIPATLNTNGDDIRQYQVSGNTGGVGDRTANSLQVTPDTYIAANWDSVPLSPTDPKNYFMYFELPQRDALTQLGEICANAYLIGTYYSNMVFAITDDKYGRADTEYRIIQNNGNILSWAKDVSGWEHIYLCIGYSNGITRSNKQTLINALLGNYNLSLTPGATPPEAFVPFGYEVDMSISDGTNAATTPIYIGNELLGKDEYIDYQEQKVFRRTENEFDYKKYFKTCTPFNDFFNYAPMQLKSNTQYTVYTNCLSGTGGTQSQVVETSVIVCPAEITFNTANGGVHGSTPFTLTTRESGLCNLGIRTQHSLNPSYPNIYGESDFADGTAYINVVEGTEVSETSIPYFQPVEPPVPLPALPTCEGTTIVDYVGSGAAPEKVFLKYRKENF